MVKIKLILPIILSLALAGCLGGSSGSGPDIGGVFKSINKGLVWQPVGAILTTSGQANLSEVNVNTLVMDPNDANTFYLGSRDNGLFYTYDQGATWQVSRGLGQVGVTAVAIEPGAKCIIYAAAANRVYRSTDCSRSWEEVYFDNDPEIKVTSLAIDHYNTSHIYAGLSRGEIIKSFDRGLSWSTLERFDNAIIEISISPHDSRLLLALVNRDGIRRSTDSGANWIDLDDKLSEVDGRQVRDLSFSRTQPGLVLVATRAGLIKSTDNGSNWSKIELITPEEETIINAVAVGTINPAEIYYVTDTSFYRSADGGINWTPKKLPTSRAGWNLLLDPIDPNIIYLTARKIN